MLVHTALTRAGDIMALSANLLKVQEMLRNFSLPEVQQVASGLSGKANRLWAMDELRRRADMQSEAEAADAEAQQGQPPMIDQYLQMSQQAMGQGPPPPPQGMPQGMPQMPQMPQGPPPSQQGIGSMMPPPPQRQMPQGMPPGMSQGMPPGMGQGMPQGPPPQMGMAGGGSVRGYAGPTGSRVGDPKVMASLDTQYQDLLNLDAEKQRYVALVRQEAINRGMDPDRAVAQIMQESGFNPNAISPAPAFAKGLAQFMDPTAKDMNLKDPFNPEDSIRAWGDYQGMLDKKYANDPARQLAAYNAGMGNVDRKFGSKEWEYPEADNYIARITGLTDRIKAGRSSGSSPAVSPPGGAVVPPIDAAVGGPPAVADVLKTYQGNPPEEDPNYYASITPDLNFGGNAGPMFGDSHRGINFGFGPSVEQGTEAYDQAVKQLDRIEEVERLGAMTPDLERKRVEIQNMMPSGFLVANAPNSFAEVGKIYNAYLNSPQMKSAREQEDLDNQARLKLGAAKRTTSSIQTFGDPTATDGLTVNRTTPPDTSDDTPETPAVEKMIDATDKAWEDIERKSSQQKVIGDTPPTGSLPAPEGAGFMESLKDGKYKSLFDFMMMSGLQYASGSNLGEAGVAGLGYLGEQQVMDNEAGRRALQDRASQATIALSEEKTRRLKAGMSMSEMRQMALESLMKNDSFLMETDASKREDMVQQMVALMAGSGSGGTNRVVVGDGGREI